MDIGMLWKDDNANRTLEEKIIRAIEYYEHKYNERPNVCVINPHMLKNESPTVVNGARLATAKTIQINHFWLGVDGNRTHHKHA